jgi:TolA-binding protein
MRSIFFVISAMFISFSGYSQTENTEAREYYNSAMDKVLKKDHKGAITDFSEAIKHDSCFIQVYENRGVSKFFLQDYRGAIDDFNTVINKWYSGRYQKSVAYFWCGIVKFDMGQKEEGCLDLKKAWKLGYSKAHDAIKGYCL